MEVFEREKKSSFDDVPLFLVMALDDIACGEGEDPGGQVMRTRPPPHTRPSNQKPAISQRRTCIGHRLSEYYCNGVLVTTGKLVITVHHSPERPSCNRSGHMSSLTKPGGGKEPERSPGLKTVPSNIDGTAY